MEIRNVPKRDLAPYGPTKFLWWVNPFLEGRNYDVTQIIQSMYVNAKQELTHSAWQHCMVCVMKPYPSPEGRNNADTLSMQSRKALKQNLAQFGNIALLLWWDHAPPQRVEIMSARRLCKDKTYTWTELETSSKLYITESTRTAMPSWLAANLLTKNQCEAATRVQTFSQACILLCSWMPVRKSQWYTARKSIKQKGVMGMGGVCMVGGVFCYAVECKHKVSMIYCNKKKKGRWWK